MYVLQRLAVEIVWFFNDVPYPCTAKIEKRIELRKPVSAKLVLPHVGVRTNSSNEDINSPKKLWHMKLIPLVKFCDFLILIT